MIDLLIHPEVRRFGILDFAAYEAIAQVGYEAALEPLRKWKAERLSL
jgi:predicted acylesterase/phospholipase RssA